MFCILGETAVCFKVNVFSLEVILRSQRFLLHSPMSFINHKFLSTTYFNCIDQPNLSVKEIG